MREKQVLYMNSYFNENLVTRSLDSTYPTDFYCRRKLVNVVGRSKRSIDEVMLLTLEHLSFLQTSLDMCH